MSNTKWNENLIESELKKITTVIGHFPRFKDLKEYKREDLISAVSRYGGIEYYHNNSIKFFNNI